MNILMITPDYPPNFGGIGSHVADLSTHLIKQGCKVTVLVIRVERSTPEPDEFEIKSVGDLTVVTFPCDFTVNFPELEGFDYVENKSPMYPFRFASTSLDVFPRVFNYLKTREPFDILHVHDAYNAYISVAIKRLFNIPMITTLHGLSASTIHVVDSNRRYIINNSNLVISVSAWMKEQLEDRFGKINTNIQVIHNGVSGDFSEEANKNKLNRINKHKTITYCGRLVPIKGCDILISAFSEIVHKNGKEVESEFKLKIIGDGPSRIELENLAEKLNVGQYVEFSGYKSSEEVREILRESSLHIVPSLIDNFPMIALEAMAEGAPVVASSVGGLIEIVKDKWNGILIPPRDIKGLKHAMLSLLNDDQLSLEYSSNGIKTAEELSWAKISAKTIEIYNQVLIENKTPV